MSETKKKIHKQNEPYFALWKCTVATTAVARQNTNAELEGAHFVGPLFERLGRCKKKKSRRRELQLSACCNFAVEEQSRRLRLYFTTPQSALFQCVPGFESQHAVQTR